MFAQLWLMIAASWQHFNSINQSRLTAFCELIGRSSLPCSHAGTAGFFFFVTGRALVDGAAVDGAAVDGAAVDGAAVDGAAVDGVAVDVGSSVSLSTNTGGVDPVTLSVTLVLLAIVDGLGVVLSLPAVAFAVASVPVVVT